MSKAPREVIDWNTLNMATDWSHFKENGILTDISYNYSFSSLETFHGNTLIADDIPDSTTIIILDGSLIVAGSIGREVTLMTRRESRILQRAAAEITGNEHHFPTLPPTLNLHFGKGKREWFHTLEPLDIAVLSPVPANREEEDKQLKLNPNYITLHIDSLGGAFFNHDTPPRMNAQGQGNFVAMRSVGDRTCLDFGGRISVAKKIGNVCTMTCGGGISAYEAGYAVTLSSAEIIRLYSPQTQRPAWHDGAISSAKGVTFFNKTPEEAAIDAKVLVERLSAEGNKMMLKEYHRASCRSQTLTGITLQNG